MEDKDSNTKKSNFDPKLIVGIVVVLAIIGGALLLGKNSKKQSQTQDSMQMQPTKTQTATKPSAGVTGPMIVNGIQTLTVEGGSYYFKPNEIRIKKGQKVKITLSNAGGFHNFVIDEFNVKSSTIPSGKTTIIEFTPDKTGTYEYYCSIGNHRQMGMKGNLIVE